MEKNNLPFISSELAGLWQMYMQETISQCMLQYFLESAEDPGIRSAVSQKLENVTQSVQTITSFFINEKLPLPVGFTDQDVNPKAPKLYSDAFILQFLSFMTHVGTQHVCANISVTAREDFRAYLIERAEKLLISEDHVFKLLLEKGLYSKAPIIPYPDQTEFVQKTNFLQELFGERRPLNVTEINHLFINCLRNAQGLELITGFIQTVQSDEIREYMKKGKELSHKYMDLFNSHMEREEMLPSTLPGVNVTSSTTPPFSDKLMLNMLNSLNIYAISVYGTSFAQSSRGDLSALYTRMIAETASYSMEGGKLMIKYGYMEAPPHVPDRNELAK